MMAFEPPLKQLSSAIAMAAARLRNSGDGAMTETGRLGPGPMATQANSTPALVQELASKVTEQDATIAIMSHALTLAKVQIGCRHDGSDQCTEALKKISEALERIV